MAIPVASSMYTLNLDGFTVFLGQHGAELLEAKGEWEIIRYRAEDKIHILYKSKRGITWTKPIAEAWRAFKQDKSWAANNTIPISYNPELTDRLIRRDGLDCFYCDKTMEQEDIQQEMLLERQHGGILHMSNLVLVHKSCLIVASTLPIIHKIRLRDSIRRENATAKDNSK